tara:strand:- start:305 stop:556 length:252 start_codon:yes stop_codon:yes gene_type:complete
MFKLMDINSLLINSDTNYIVGVIVILFSAKLLNDKNKPGLISRRSQRVIMVQNIFFLTAIVVIANINIVLGVILGILYLSMNM